jgi:hypothetical protein
MKTQFLVQMNEVVTNASQFIKDKVVNGKKFIIHDYNPDNEESADVILDLPFVSEVGKYGAYSQHAILSVYEKDGGVAIDTVGTTEGDEGVLRTFPLSDLYDDFMLCQVADMIGEQL